MVVRRPPFRSEAAWGPRQKTSAFPQRRDRLRFPGARQVSSPRNGQQVLTPRASPAVRSARPPCSLRAMLLSPPGAYCEPALKRAKGEAPGFSSAPSACMAPPVSARPALRAPFSSSRGRRSSRGLGRPWMKADEGRQTESPATHRHGGEQEEKVELPAQGLMGQEAGSFPRLT